MRAPIGPKHPCLLRLSAGQIRADFHLVKPCAPRHGVLIRNHMTRSAQAPRKPRHTQAFGPCKAMAIGKPTKGNADRAMALRCLEGRVKRGGIAEFNHLYGPRRLW